jgi:hypothetical protein
LNNLVATCAGASRIFNTLAITSNPDLECVSAMQEFNGKHPLW